MKLTAPEEKEMRFPRLVLLTFLLVIPLFYTLQCTFLQNVLGLDVLETITWGAQHAWGNSKHPPLSGFAGYTLSCLAGHRDWLLYFAAQFCIAAGVFFVYASARYFLDERSAVLSALLLYFLFYCNPSETKFCTYPVEMMLGPMIFYTFFRAIRSTSPINWVCFGLLCALALLNKYSSGLLLLALGCLFFAERQSRSKLHTAGPYLAVIAGFLLFLPHLCWLAENDFVCFRHVGARMEAERAWYLPLVTLGTMLYPVGMTLAPLLLAALPEYRRWRWPKTDDPLFRRMLWLTLFPGSILVLLSLCGSDVIMMWFCSLTPFAGVLAITLSPVPVDDKIFRRVLLLLILYTVVTFAATTADLLFQSRPRLHTRPEAVTEPVSRFWHQNCEKKGPIPAVTGDFFLAMVMENYTPSRPPAVDPDDRARIRRHLPQWRETGVLVLGKPAQIREFEAIFGTKPLSCQKITYRYRALLGKEKERIFYAACFSGYGNDAETNTMKETK